MININRNNYEQYFIDFLDGNLNQPEQEELFLFLDANPDLKEELENFDGELIIEEETRFENKNLLLKKSLLSEVTSTNFDELCIASLENDLRESEKKYFQELIQDDPGKQKEFELYCLTKIPFDRSIVFDQKKLLKKELKPKFKWNYAIISAAASVVIFMGIYLFLPKQTDSIGENHVAESMEQTFDQVRNKAESNLKNEFDVEKLRPIKIYLSTNTNLANKVELKEYYQEKTKTNNEQIVKIEKLTALNIKLESDSKNYAEHLAVMNLNDYIIEQKTDEGKYFTIGSFLALTFNERVLNKKDKDKLEWFDVAQASVEGINKLTGSNMKLERKYDENGIPDKTEFNSKLIAFSSPVKKD